MKLKIVAIFMATCIGPIPVLAGMAEAEKWITEEFQPSTLSDGRAESRDGMVHPSCGAIPGDGNQCTVRDHSDP